MNVSVKKNKQYKSYRQKAFDKLVWNEQQFQTAHSADKLLPKSMLLNLCRRIDAYTDSYLKNAILENMSTIIIIWVNKSEENMQKREHTQKTSTQTAHSKRNRNSTMKIDKTTRRLT